MTLYSFRKFNPNWTMVLYLSESNEVDKKPWRDCPVQDFHNFSGEDVFKKVLDLDVNIIKCSLSDFENETGPSYGGDFFKWNKLSKDAEFYSDLDILFIKPFDELYSRAKDSDVILNHNGAYFSIGLLGSSGKPEFFGDVYKTSVKSYTSNRYQSAGVDCLLQLSRKLTNRSRLTIDRSFKVFKRHYPDLTFYSFPMEQIYPWNCTEMKEVFEKNHSSSLGRCIGIHWYAGDITSQKYNNILTEHNFRDFNNTFCQHARKVIEQ